MVVVVSPATASTRTTRIFFLYAGCCFLLSSLWHHVAASPPPSFSFDFSNMSRYRLQDLRFEGDAALNGDLVDLTCNSKEEKENYYCKGRMSYNHPVPFYDNNTGEVASFATSFTFVINLTKGEKKGDGMSFFLASYPSRLPPGSYGNVLGLINSSETTASGADRFVAVEFDTYGNPWDPTGCYDHLGIDISSVTSVSTTRLPSFSLNGTMTASITFDNTTRMLEASLHFDSNHSLGTAQVKTQLPDRLDALLPPEVAVGFSATTGGNFELHQILSWSFNSTMAPKETLGANVQPKQGQALSDKGHNNDTRVIIIGGAVLSIPVVWFILSCFMWKRARVSFVKRAGLGEFRRFEYRDLFEATGKFSVENKLGEGAFGVVHKGALKKYDGQQEEVAVKKIKESALGETNAFLDELKASSRTHHKNLVRLKGWCCSWNKWKLVDFMCWCRQQQNADLFLVYELVPNGNLHDHLYTDRPGQAILQWETRYEIAKGLGSGLCYLHHDCKPYILHRDIKPCNILLDADFNPKLADFGLSRVADHNNTILATRAIGTEGYLDPLCMKDGKVKFSRASDVYSFGIVLLNIACTQKTPDLVREMYRRSGPENFFEAAADVNLCGAFDRMQMKQVAVLGLWCCFPDDTQRPSLQEAMKVLENDTTLLQKAIKVLENDTPLLQKAAGSRDNASSMTSPDGQAPLIPASKRALAS